MGYSSSSKAHRVFNERTQCIEEIIHVAFDEDGNLKKLESIDEDELNELFQFQKCEGSKAVECEHLETDDADPDPSVKTKKMTSLKKDLAI